MLLGFLFYVASFILTFDIVTILTIDETLNGISKLFPDDFGLSGFFTPGLYRRLFISNSQWNYFEIPYEKSSF